MHPGPEVIAIETRKAALRERIARRREAVGADTSRVLRPLAQVDEGFRLWRRLPGFARTAALPVLFGLVQFAFPRVRTLRKLVQWAPVLLSGWRILRGAWEGARGASASR
jgi:hypothetical protein